MNDSKLLAQCDVDTYRASGPGGQKRNKTSSAVRLRHSTSGQLVIAEESRSQHDNKSRAIRRLRSAIALNVRCTPTSGDARALIQDHLTTSGKIEISARNEAYPLLVAEILDVLADLGCKVRETADQLGITTSQLSRFLTAEPKLLKTVNEMRARAGLSALRPAHD